MAHMANVIIKYPTACLLGPPELENIIISKVSAETCLDEVDEVDARWTLVHFIEVVMTVPLLMVLKRPSVGREHRKPMSPNIASWLSIFTRLWGKQNYATVIKRKK